MAQLAKAITGGPGRSKRPLNPAQWSIAYDAFALSAAVCGMMPYTTAMAHKVELLRFMFRFVYLWCNALTLTVDLRACGADRQGQREAPMAFDRL